VRNKRIFKENAYMLAYIKKKYYLCSGFDNSHSINTIKTFGTIMVRTTFNRLRSVKDSLPHGSMDAIAAELEISGDEVRAYFNGEGNADYHIEPGPDGGIVVFSNTRILEVALRIAWEVQNAL
jgi:hypothetical protein